MSNAKCQMLNAQIQNLSFEPWALGLGPCALSIAPCPSSIIEYHPRDGSDPRVDSAAHHEDPPGGGLPRADQGLSRRAGRTGSVVAAERGGELGGEPGAAPR